MTVLPTMTMTTPPPLVHAMAGSLGSAISLLLFYPLERARIEMQAHAADDDNNDEDRDTCSPTFLLNETCNPNQNQIQPKDGPDRERKIEQSDSSIHPNPKRFIIGRFVFQPFSSFSSQQEKATPPPSSSLLSSSRTHGIISCLVKLHKRKQLYRGVQPVVATLALSNFIFFYVLQACKQLLQLRRTQRQVQSNAVYASHAFVASSIAGILNILITNPLWVANLRLVQGDSEEEGNHHSQHDSPTNTRPSKGIFQIIQDIVQQEGIRHLWSGTWASLLLVSNPAIQHFTYEQMKSHLLQKHHLVSYSSPLQNVVTQDQGRMPSFLSWFFHILSRIPSIVSIQSSSSSSSSFTTKIPITTTTTTTATTTTTILRPMEAFLFGAFSKAIATIVTYPLQLAQVVMRLQKEPQVMRLQKEPQILPSGQTSNKDPNHTKRDPNHLLQQPHHHYPKRFRGTWDCIHQLYQNGGIRALYAGIDAKLLQTILSAAFTFLTYEQMLLILTHGHQSFFFRSSR